ncbi:hypothetical protein BX616_010409 [Lobosporangium transversale]|uniref:Etoposide-induced protein 2.4-domain-containing protein n=1 Tax=Lobosporangium transversale TaxID=64571 RepID=A0A1Y2H3S7_9FUNG|nr:hypothetical protein BCR41DRAFT_2197 [Lobosporangium transversale]KAF9912124.1 hypothetical protein BX616_010409 [Lobosporangium transversale]ORZ28684.1 hypothetical protein BCR41DRAFT_2197 [Lobosporangium transversale]|eukprot:XP_021886357.1 hypothetical protein BCR41DRAFT_2197 [Lobosporangium transversale]
MFHIKQLALNLREWVSQFGSGLQHLLEVFQHKNGSETKRVILALSFQCSAIYCIIHIVIKSIPFTIGPYFVHNPFFYPSILVCRYLYPFLWDKIFINTVQLLGCSERPDITAKPALEYFSQTKRYYRRILMAYISTMILRKLIDYSGLLSILCKGLALVTIDLSLRYRGTQHVYWKLVILAVFVIYPRFLIWGLQIFTLQQLLMYEFLQPYLVRVGFKQWEERAWISLYGIEMQGFVFGVWLLCCNVPWIGIAVVPWLFPAVVFLLSRSCGSMANTRQKHGGYRNSLVEKQSLGVEGDWEDVDVKTTIRSSINASFSRPDSHSEDGAQVYSLDRGVDVPTTREIIEADKERLAKLKLKRYQEERIYYLESSGDSCLTIDTEALTLSHSHCRTHPTMSCQRVCKVR